ncbi:MAG: CotH kinase family protein [Bacteroidetes bacterium]|nr:CotH kinase family protein [Bacteroidota bacterium]
MKKVKISKVKHRTLSALLLLLFLIIISSCETYIPETIDQNTIPSTLEPVYQKTIVINELAGWNTYLLEDEDGDYSDWVELYNISTEPVNLKGWYLSDDRLKLNKWMFSATYILDPGEHLIIYLSGKDRRTGRNDSQYHTNFSINNSTEILFLTSPDRIIQDILESRAPLSNHSIGRTLDGLPSWNYNLYPTPGEINSLTIPIPKLSHTSGFYNSDQPLVITAENIPEEYELRYTISDGIEIDEQDQALNRYEWGYPSNVTGILYTGSIPIEKTSVLKARLYKGLTAGPEVVNTYFIDEEIHIPIISLTTDPANLWSDETGIYVAGNDPNNPNYRQEGWEVPAQFTYFTDSSKQIPDIDIPVDLRIFGSATREFPNKSLAIYSRDREIPNLFFSNNSGTVYSLLLRTGASDFTRAVMRDIVTSELVKQLGIDAQDYQQTLLFINGQFWGISNIREKINEEMIEDKYQINPDELDLVFGTFSTDPRNGTVDAYSEMYKFITGSNLYLEKYYNQVESYIDIDSFIDYIIVETFINNSDWPANNVKTWKSWEPNSVWRWIIYDTDASYDTEEFWSKTNPLEDKVIGRADFDSINRLIEISDTSQVVQIFNSLMSNKNFKDRFIQRYEELIGADNGVIVNPEALLGTNRITSIIDSISENIEPYIPRQITRWLPERLSYMVTDAVGYEDKSINRWYHNVNVLRDFASQRPDYIARFLHEMNKSYVPTEKNIIENGSFDDQYTNWNIYWSNDVSVQSVVSINNNNIGEVKISDSYQTSGTPAPTGILAFVYDGIDLHKETTYELTISIRSNKEPQQSESILAYLFKISPDYTRYAQIEIVPTQEWQTVKKFLQ